MPSYLDSGVSWTSIQNAGVVLAFLVLVWWLDSRRIVEDL